MSRILSLFCVLSILLPCLLILTACKKGQDPVPTPSTPPQKPEEKAPALYLPTAGSFDGHSTEDFSTFVYYEPSLETLLGALAIATERLKSEETTYTLALETVSAIEELYAEYMSMLSYAQIIYSSDKTNTYFLSEYKRLYATLPDISFALENLFSAVSASPHGAELAKTEYFPEDIVERYKNGGIYTAQTLPLFEKENELTFAANDISYDTVTITYNKSTDTVTNILATLEDGFGKNSAEYQQAQMHCDVLYNKEANAKRAEYYLSLLGVRREIADALGYESYAVLAAERLGYGASKTDAEAVLSAVETYILPVYQALSATNYFNSNTSKVDKIRFAEQTMNTLTHFYESCGGKLFDGYNYLLQHSLISYGSASETRAANAFATYFGDRTQPFLYIGMDGTAADYITLAKAVGSTLCFYQNNTENGSFSAMLRTPEITDAFGLSLGLLTLQGMKEELSKTEDSMADSTYLVLLKNEMYNAFQITLTQCMRTQIEWEAYALAKDEISENAINDIIARAAERFGCFEIENETVATLSLSTAGLLNYDMLQKPMLTFSDVTSNYVAVSLFIKECSADGAGFAALETLLAADIESQSYADILSLLSIPSPAEPEAARALATALYEVLTGYSYNAEPRVAVAPRRA